MRNVSQFEARIRTVDSSNIADIIRLAAETGLSPWTHNDLLAEIRNPKAILLKLLSDSNEVLGFVVGRVIPGGADKYPDAEIYNIAVRQDFQRRRLGQRLLSEFRDRCRQGRVQFIWLEVRESNGNAIGFYESNGFKPVQVRANFYRNPTENAIIMRLALKNETA
ncbi:MAG: ribosomal protein S18-alanine N-acetyltransferase [Acidobacteria bacterium]|nr:ribosomal protein S18-alanine N-acetyltransferase [Acidobacteriota bacterium]